MCVFLIKPEENKYEERIHPLKVIMDKIRVDEQYSSEHGLEFFSQFVRLVEKYRNHIFSKDVYFKDKLYDSSEVSFITMLVEEATGRINNPRPLSPFMDMFALETTEYSLKQLNERDIAILKSTDSLTSEAFVHNLAKGRSFMDMFIIAKLLFGIK